MKALIVFTEGDVDSLSVLNDDDPQIETLKSLAETSGRQFAVVRVDSISELTAYLVSEIELSRSNSLP